MIDPSFSAYGVVESFRKEPNHGLNRISVLGQTEVAMYIYPFATTWDYVDGMTILVIQDGGKLKRYYLDRAVTIYAGVCFGFYSLGRESTVAGDTAIMRADMRSAAIDVSNELQQIQKLQVFTLFYQVGANGLFFRGEQHPPLELTYVVKGTLRNYCDGREFGVRPNEFVIFSPNQWHMQYSEEEVQFLTVSFLWDEHDFSHLFHCVTSASSEIQRSVHALLQEYEQDLPGRDEFLDAQMKLLLLQILRLPKQEDTSKKPSPASERAHRLIMDKAMQIVSERIYGKLSVPELAAAVNVSVSQLTALFRNYLGTTPAKYITHIRLEESKLLLNRKQLSVGEISELLGYASIQHFSKQFHAWFGYTPSDCAKRE